MISQDAITAKVDEYLSQNNPISPIIQQEVEAWKKSVFYHLAAAWESFPFLYFSQGGRIEVGLSFEAVVAHLRIHPRPAEVHAQMWGTEAPVLERRLLIGEESESAYILDNERQKGASPVLDFYESFFGLPARTFKCSLVEPSYGLRADKKSRIQGLLYESIERKTPLFAHTVLARKNGKELYLVNGLRI